MINNIKILPMKYTLSDKFVTHIDGVKTTIQTYISLEQALQEWNDSPLRHINRVVDYFNLNINVCSEVYSDIRYLKYNGHHPKEVSDCINRIKGTKGEIIEIINKTYECIIDRCDFYLFPSLRLSDMSFIFSPNTSDGAPHDIIYCDLLIVESAAKCREKSLSDLGIT